MSNKPRDKHMWLDLADSEILDEMAEREGLTGKGRYGDMARIILKRAIRQFKEGAQ